MGTSPSDDWNLYWTQMLGDASRRRSLQIGFHSFLLMESVIHLRERNVQRVLFAGNGISLLPYAMMHLGFQVTVVDISSVANDAVAAVQPTPELLASFLPEYKQTRDRHMGSVLERDRDASLQRVDREAVPGGSLTLITADIMDWEPKEPLDAIYDDRLTMLLPTSDWPAIARRYYHWLGASGISLLHTINLGGTIGQDVSATRTPFEDAFTAAGFQQQDLKYRKTTPAPSKGLRRLFRRFQRPPAEPTPQPDGKLVCFWYGSG